MRHRKAHVRLGRKSGQRKALLNNLAMSLFAEERIQTTLPRAKALRSFAEKLLTRAKDDTLHARREVARVVSDKAILSKMFGDLGRRFAARPGGYTRIYKLGYRRGDSAEMALIELVDRPTKGKAEAPAAPAKSKKLVERESGADAKA